MMRSGKTDYRPAFSFPVFSLSEKAILWQSQIHFSLSHRDPTMLLFWLTLQFLPRLNTLLNRDDAPAKLNSGGVG